MCGIFGWTFKQHAGIGQGQREVLASVLAIANSTRGDQSWGMYGRNGKNIRIVKEVGDICRASFAPNGMTPLLMAHTRFSTHGKICRENAHPHQAGNIVLCHNGVIFNHEDLNKKYERKCEVDSQHLALHLSEGRDFSDVQGYGAIEWVDLRKPDEIFLCRMSGGSLTAYGIENWKGKQVGTVWSSDREHLREAIASARVKSFPYLLMEEGKVYRIHNGVMYETKLPDLVLDHRTWSETDMGHYYASGGERSRGIVIHGSYWTEEELAAMAEDEEDEKLADQKAEAQVIDLTSGKPLVKDPIDIAKAEQEQEDDVEKYLAASRLARDLGLVPVDRGLWADEAGEPVSQKDLEEMLLSPSKEEREQDERIKKWAAEAKVAIKVRQAADKRAEQAEREKQQQEVKAILH